MSIITMATSKGGAGKTTVAQALLGTLARHGHRVAAIDADFNHTLSSWVSTFAAYPIDARAELDETRIVPLAAELEEKHELVVIDTAGAATQATVFAIGTADRGLDAGFGKAFSVLDREVLAATVAVMHEPTPAERASGMERLLQGVEDEARLRAATGAPADDPWA